MGDNVWVVVAAFVGGGAVTALVSWPVHKLTEARSHRRQLLAEWRAGISKWESSVIDEDGQQHVNLGIDPTPFTREAWFKSLEPHLSAEVRALVDSNDVHIAVGGRNYYARKLSDEVSRLERAWKLG